MITVLDRLKELYHKYKISSTCNDEGYSDVEILIDGYSTGIWVDDYDLFLNEWNRSSWEFIYPQVKEYIDNLIPFTELEKELNIAGYKDNPESLEDFNKLNHIAEIIIQQKSDKIEPKFHEGEWVV